MECTVAVAGGDGQPLLWAAEETGETSEGTGCGCERPRPIQTRSTRKRVIKIIQMMSHRHHQFHHPISGTSPPSASAPPNVHRRVFRSSSRPRGFPRPYLEKAGRHDHRPIPHTALVFRIARSRSNEHPRSTVSPPACMFRMQTRWLVFALVPASFPKCFWPITTPYQPHSVSSHKLPAIPNCHRHNPPIDTGFESHLLACPISGQPTTRHRYLFRASHQLPRTTRAKRASAAVRQGNLLSSTSE